MLQPFNEKLIVNRGYSKTIKMLINRRAYEKERLNRLTMSLWESQSIDDCMMNIKCCEKACEYICMLFRMESPFSESPDKTQTLEQQTKTYQNPLFERDLDGCINIGGSEGT